MASPITKALNKIAVILFLSLAISLFAQAGDDLKSVAQVNQIETLLQHRSPENLAKAKKLSGELAARAVSSDPEVSGYAFQALDKLFFERPQAIQGNDPEFHAVTGIRKEATVLADASFLTQLEKIIAADPSTVHLHKTAFVKTFFEKLIHQDKNSPAKEILLAAANSPDHQEEKWARSLIQKEIGQNVTGLRTKWDLYYETVRDPNKKPAIQLKLDFEKALASGDNALAKKKILELLNDHPHYLDILDHDGRSGGINEPGMILQAFPPASDWGHEPDKYEPLVHELGESEGKKFIKEERSVAQSVFGNGSQYTEFRLTIRPDVDKLLDTDVLAAMAKKIKGNDSASRLLTNILALKGYTDKDFKLTPQGLALKTLPAATPKAALSAPAKLTSAELSELAGLTSDSVPEIRKAREIANAHNAVFAAYGGTSREIIDFVQTKTAELGSADAYRDWLKKEKTIPLLDWHRIASDLDFMLVPKEGMNITEARAEELRNLIKKEINDEFPGTYFYKKFDVNLAPDFFSKFLPQHYHYEAISNIPLSEKGVMQLAPLKVLIGSKKVDLPTWGLNQFVAKKLDFRRSAQAIKWDTEAAEVYADVLKVFRWIRYASENPQMELTPNSASEIRTLMKDIERPGRKEIALKLLKDGHADSLKAGAHEAYETQPQKLIVALEKAQIYSKDSARTRKLLDDFGITQLARDAEIDKQRIFQPLADGIKRLPGQASPKPRLVLFHRTSLNAAQNISQGALWMSNYETTIGNRTTTAAFGPGLYAAPGIESLEYGDFYVKIELNPEAVPGVDYEVHPHPDDKRKNYYVLKRKNALAVNEAGDLAIEKISYQSIVDDIKNKLDPKLHTAPRTEAELNSLRVAFAKVTSPRENPKDQKLFLQILDDIKDQPELRANFISSYLAKPNELPKIINSSGPFADRIYQEMSSDSFFKKEINARGDIFQEMMRERKIIAAHHPDFTRVLKKGIQRFAATMRNSVFYEEFFEKSGIRQFFNEEYPAEYQALLDETKVHYNNCVRSSIFFQGLIPQ